MSDNMSNEDKNKLKRMYNRMNFIIKNYCDEIGCKNCTLKRAFNGAFNDCEAADLQSEIMDLEFNGYKE